MYEKTCRCGASKKSFNIDIGPFFVDSCCLEAGYDDLGNLKKKPLQMEGLPSKDELAAEAAKLQEDTSPEPEDPPEIVIPTLDEKKEEPVLPTDQTTPVKEEVKGETEDQKKAREKAEKKAKEKSEKEAKKAAKEAEKSKASKQDESKKS